VISSFFSLRNDTLASRRRLATKVSDGGKISLLSQRNTTGDRESA